MVSGMTSCCTLSGLRRYAIDWTVSGNPSSNSYTMLSSFFYIGESSLHESGTAAAQPASQWEQLQHPLT